MKDKERGQLASLTQTRDTLVKLRTALKNKINNILSARGLNLAKEALSSEKKLAEVLELPFDEIVQIELRVLVGQICRKVCARLFGMSACYASPGSGIRYGRMSAIPDWGSTILWSGYQ